MSFYLSVAPEDAKLHAFPNSAPDEGQCSATGSGNFISGVSAVGTHLYGVGWLRSRSI
jgi:hypothetical protein